MKEKWLNRKKEVKKRVKVYKGQNDNQDNGQNGFPRVTNSVIGCCTLSKRPFR